MEGPGGGAAEPRDRREGARAAGAQGVACAVFACYGLSQPLHRELGGGRGREREKCLRLDASSSQSAPQALWLVRRKRHRASPRSARRGAREKTRAGASAFRRGGGGCPAGGGRGRKG